MSDSLVVLNNDLDIVTNQENDIEPDDILDWNESKINWRYEIAD